MNDGQLIGFCNVISYIITIVITLFLKNYQYILIQKLLTNRKFMKKKY